MLMEPYLVLAVSKASMRSLCNQKSMIQRKKTIHTETMIVANNKATTESGNDTNVRGSQVAENTINVDVGNNLNIEKYKEYSVSIDEGT